jgi:hypothetical protein
MVHTQIRSNKLCLWHLRKLMMQVKPHNSMLYLFPSYLSQVKATNYAWTKTYASSRD